MDQDKARKLSAAREHLSAAFSAALVEIDAIPVGAERSRHLRGLATLLVGQPEEFRANAVSQCPELEMAEPFPDTLLGPGEHELVAQLTQADLDVIEEALLHSSVSSWRKLPRVIGGAMVTLEGRFPGLALGLYVQRVVALVEGGRLLAKGNLEFMRLSEVRVPASDEHVASQETRSK
jgi:hypothetical protein